MDTETLKQLVGTLVRLSTLGNLGSKNVRKEVLKVIEGIQTFEDARASAVAQAKRDTLEDLGHYLQRLSAVARAKVDRRSALALTDGLMDSAVIKEKTFSKGGKEGIRVEVSGTLTMAALARRIQGLLDDRKQLERLKASQKRDDELIAHQVGLEKKNREMVSKGGTAAEKKELKAAFKDNTRKLIAQEWHDKVKALWNGKEYTDPQKAVEYFDEAIKLVPDYPAYYFHRGNANYYWRQFKLALRDYDKALNLDKDYAEAFNNRGNTYYQQKKYDKSIKDYDEAISRDNRDADAHNNRANTYYKQGYFDDALEDYSTAVKLAPRNPIYLNNRGITHDAMKSYKKALKDYTQAIEIDSRYSLAYFNRGTTLEAMEDYRQAMADFNQAIKLNPKYGEAYYHLGLAFQKLGHKGPACREWKKAAKLGNLKAKAAREKNC